jgi:hypothetical protein
MRASGPWTGLEVSCYEDARGALRLLVSGYTRHPATVNRLTVRIRFPEIHAFSGRFRGAIATKGAGEVEGAQDLKSLEMSLDKEAFAMRTPISRIAGRVRAASWDRRGSGVRTDEDSPYSPYLRSWIAHQAAQHRALLRNIDAAARIGLAPAIIPH